jgi:hypothetical protein
MLELDYNILLLFYTACPLLQRNKKCPTARMDHERSTAIIMLLLTTINTMLYTAPNAVDTSAGHEKADMQKLRLLLQTNRQSHQALA